MIYLTLVMNAVMFNNPYVMKTGLSLIKKEMKSGLLKRIEVHLYKNFVCLLY